MVVCCVDLTNHGTVDKPVNREPPMIELVSSWITKEINYDRNHGPILHKKACDHAVIVDGLVPSPLKLTVESLMNDFPQHTVTCALQCAGNRRHTMRTRIKEVLGVDWCDGAMMNCKWSGPRVRDVLLAAGLENKLHQQNGVSQRHVQFASYGSKTQEDDWYGGSIPFERAMREDMDVILAVRMNGQPLSPRHGYPVRSLVPGVLGARSVKWLDRITVSDKESPNFYQQRDYKILPPCCTDKKAAEEYWGKMPSMLEMPINTCAAFPTTGATVSVDADGCLQVKGYAVPQGSEGPVVRVQVSGDEGATWTDAELDNGGDEGSKWSWVLWNAKIKMVKGKNRKIFAKATDAGGNVQSDEQSPWNLRGVAYNGYEVAYDITIV